LFAEKKKFSGLEFFLPWICWSSKPADPENFTLISTEKIVVLKSFFFFQICDPAYVL